eukprot:scaffold58273_cov47-Prasinocladus_malaysianus.AAC.1
MAQEHLDSPAGGWPPLAVERLVDRVGGSEEHSRNLSPDICTVSAILAPSPELLGEVHASCGPVGAG